jgi:hypothetical protein
MPKYEKHVYWTYTTYTAWLSYKTAPTLSLLRIPTTFIPVTEWLLQEKLVLKYAMHNINKNQRGRENNFTQEIKHLLASRFSSLFRNCHQELNTVSCTMKTMLRYPHIKKNKPK